MSRSRRSPQLVEAFAPTDNSPPGIHERRAYRIQRPDGSVEEGAYERKFGPSRTVFGPTDPGYQLADGEERFTDLLGGAIAELLCWLVRVVLALFRTSAVLFFAVIAWDLSEQASGSGWPGLAFALTVSAMVSAWRRGGSE